MITYSITTADSDFRTTSSITAAREFVSLLRNGRGPSARCIVDVGSAVSVRVLSDYANNIGKMRKLLIAAAN